MSTLVSDFSASRAIALRLTADTLAVDLSDGRTISVPLGWYPRLLHGTPEERANYRLIGEGEGFIGRPWMRILVLRMFSLASGRARA